MPGKKRARNGSGAKPKSAEEVEGVISQLSVDELRKQLVDIGEKPGPIDASNKDIYTRMLARKRVKLETETSSSTFTDSSSPVSSTTLVRSPISLASVIGGPGTGVRTPTLSRQALTKTPTSKRTPVIKGKATKHPSTTKDFSSFVVRGLVAATHTPLTDSGELNLSVLSRYADHLLKSGVHNVFDQIHKDLIFAHAVNGSTGESLCLTVSERKQLAEEWVKVARGRITVIVHVGTESLKDTCELASHAQAIGAAAIGVQPTTFFKPATIEHLVCYLEKVTEAAPGLPMYYYHIPCRTGVKLSMEEFLDSAFTRLPTLRGIKYTDPDLMSFSRCVTSHGGKYQILHGADEQVLGALCLGGTAAIGTTYNYAGKLYNRLFSAFKANNLEGARLEQRRSQAMIKLLFKYGGDA